MIDFELEAGRLREEQQLIENHKDGMLLILKKYQDVAENLPMQAIKMLQADDVQGAQRAALLHQVLTEDMPRIYENIVNFERTTHKFSFKEWLSRKFGFPT